MLYEDVYVGQNVCLMEDLTDTTDSYYRCLSLPIGTYGAVVSLGHKGVHNEVGVDWDVPPDSGGYLHTLNDTLKDDTGFYIKAEFVEPVDNIEDFKCDYAPVESLF